MDYKRHNKIHTDENFMAEKIHEKKRLKIVLNTGGGGGGSHSCFIYMKTSLRLLCEY